MGRGAWQATGPWDLESRHKGPTHKQTVYMTYLADSINSNFSTSDFCHIDKHKYSSILFLIFPMEDFTNLTVNPSIT